MLIVPRICISFHPNPLILHYFNFRFIIIDPNVNTINLIFNQFHLDFHNDTRAKDLTTNIYPCPLHLNLNLSLYHFISFFFFCSFISNSSSFFYNFIMIILI